MQSDTSFRNRTAKVPQKQAAHTPGPWRLGEDAQGPCTVLHPTRDGVAIASLTSTHVPANGFHDDWYVYGEDGVLDTAATRQRIDERNANARLIAAAPDLYDACKRYVAALDAMLLPDDPETLLLREALAKAEGR